MRARLLASALCLCLAGCSHYRLGTSGKLSFSTLYVEPVANRAMIPQAQAVVSTQIREAFAEDGRVALADSSSDADATLTVVLTDYHRAIAAVRENDTGLASKFTLTLGATCTLRDNRTGRTLFENRKIEVSRGAFTDNGLPSSTSPGNQLQSEYNTLPLLAEDLAARVSHTVLDVW
jgi:hypothetical protein